MNTDRIKEIFDKLPLGLVLVVYLGYLGFDFYTFKTDPQSPLLVKQAQIETTKAENARLDTKVKQANEFYRTLEQKREEIRAMSSQLNDMKATLTEEMDSPAFMKMVITEATKVGLSVSSVKPADFKDREFYSEQTFELKFRGIFVQFLSFLQRLSEAKRIMTISEISISKFGKSTAKYVQVDGLVHIKAYKYLGSKADDIARAGGSAVEPPAAPPAAPVSGG